MSTQTTHLKLDLREASDIFNPLSTNANFESLDNIIYEIQKKGGVPTFTTTASANLLKLSENPTPNSTVFKFVAAGDANTWSFSETINDIVALDGSKKTVKGGDMYVAWVNSANAMVVIAWPDVVNAQTFDGKGPNEWATTAQLQAVNQSAANATQTAQAAATVANNALKVAEAAGLTVKRVWTNPTPTDDHYDGGTIQLGEGYADAKLFLITTKNGGVAAGNEVYTNILMPTTGLTQTVAGYKVSNSIGKACFRSCTINDGGQITFGYGYIIDDPSDNTMAIPYNIYAIS